MPKSAINKTKRNYTVDLFKFFAALLIIGIHTEPFSDINENVYFFVVNVFCRLAVPFFAVCSGYYITKTLNKNDYRIATIKRQEIKLIILYVIWTILYFLYDIPFAIKGGYFTIKNFIGYGINTFTSGSSYHLWYLISLIYALPLFYLCVKHLKKKSIILLMIVLYCVKVISYGYVKWLPSPLLLVFNLFHKFDALFNAVFLLLPLLLLGYIIATGITPNIKKSMLGLIISFILLSVEAFVLKSFGQDSVSFIFFTLPTAFFAFSTVIQLNFAQDMKIGKLLGAVSLFIYCFHPMVVGLLPKDMFSLFKYVIVAFSSVLVALGYYFLKKWIKQKRIKE